MRGVKRRSSGHSLLDARYAHGVEHAERALAIAERTGNRELSLILLYLLGVNLLGFPDMSRGVDRLRSIVEGPDAELAKGVIGLSAAPYVLACNWLASAHAWLGEVQAAESYTRRAIEVAEESNHPYALAITYTWRTTPMAIQGNFSEALPMCEVAVRLCETKQLLGWLPYAYSRLGWILSWAGRPTEGVPYTERAVTMFEAIGVEMFLSQRYVEWAEGLLLGGKFVDARRVAKRAIDIAVEHGERSSEAWAHCVVADIDLASNFSDTTLTRTHYERAQALAAEKGLRPLQARSHFGLGKLYRRMGARDQAHWHLVTATTMYREMGMRLYLEQAQR